MRACASACACVFIHTTILTQARACTRARARTHYIILKVYIYNIVVYMLYRITNNSVFQVGVEVINLYQVRGQFSKIID